MPQERFISLFSELDQARVALPGVVHGIVAASVLGVHEEGVLAGVRVIWTVVHVVVLVLIGHLDLFFWDCPPHQTGHHNRGDLY